MVKDLIETKCYGLNSGPLTFCAHALPLSYNFHWPQTVSVDRIDIIHEQLIMIFIADSVVRVLS